MSFYMWLCIFIPTDIIYPLWTLYFKWLLVVLLILAGKFQFENCDLCSAVIIFKIQNTCYFLIQKVFQNKTCFYSRLCIFTSFSYLLYPVLTLCFKWLLVLLLMLAGKFQFENCYWYSAVIIFKLRLNHHSISIW